MAGPENLSGSRPVRAEYDQIKTIVRRELADREAAALTGGYRPSLEYLGVNRRLRILAEKAIANERAMAMANESAIGRPDRPRFRGPR